MCFHSEQTKFPKDVESRFKAKIEDFDKFKPSSHFNGFDFPQTPIIIDENPNEIVHYNWGLIPAWAKDDNIQKMTLNARIETLDDKPSFKNSINKRCLVITTGFYEWQWHDTKGKNKTKYEIGIGNHDLYAYAGLYSHWVDKTTGEIRSTYTIVTTEANPLMAEIHNIKKRMPVILKPEDESKWLAHVSVKDFAYPYEVNLVAHKSDSSLTLF
ncbi:SOS response-associated peptidase [Flavobacterium sp. LB3R33]|uniref:SOS response-associated peptidase n=1 Tax=Flavobacterium sp. LB3R33 TaxID=3401721 RepID=UPI003AAC5A3C